MNLESRHPLLSASLLSLALALAPQQAQAAPRPAPAAPAAATAATAGTAEVSSLDILSVWLDAVRMQLTRWLPDGSGPALTRPEGAARAARPGAARTPAVSIRPAPRPPHRWGGWKGLDCGPQVDPNGNCG